MLPLRNTARSSFLFKQLAAVPHEVGFRNRMLCGEPCSLGTISTRETFVWPSKAFKYVAQLPGVLSMYRLHARVVPIEQGAVGFQLGSQAQVALLHSEQCLSERRSHTKFVREA